MKLTRLFFQNLTELDVSDNAIESLDLSAVDKLQVLQCSRNVLAQLSVHGKHLTSLIAGNNRKILNPHWYVSLFDLKMYRFFCCQDSRN